MLFYGTSGLAAGEATNRNVPASDAGALSLANNARILSALEGAAAVNELASGAAEGGDMVRILATEPPAGPALEKGGAIAGAGA